MLRQVIPTLARVYSLGVGMLKTAAIRIGGRSKRSFSEFLNREITSSEEGEVQEAVFCVTL